ncbi:hypothetical protein TNCT_465111 [Trichonephila clavata]|uniref:Uncharacterized protein n=1 Tax=Trichonephila clavata TaxID=2740835 RepID=A0A8X6GNM5_TRICU|nr:hypothetical protein TNCT_465111 [Trichonephila clavata]
MAEAQTFELLKKKRKSFRTAVTKVVNELEAELSNSDLNVDRLSELVETLSIKFEPLTLVDQQLEPLFEPEQFDGEFEITEEYREKIRTTSEVISATCTCPAGGTPNIL